MKGSSILQLLVVASALLLNLGTTTDCFAWSVTKRADYIEVLPLLLYYDHVNWINLDATKTCTYKTFEATFLKFYSNDFSASYQMYTKNGLACQLNTTSYDYTPMDWLNSNNVMADPDVCGYLVTITNSGSAAQMMTVIRTGAELLKTSIALVSAAVVTLYMVNL